MFKFLKTYIPFTWVSLLIISASFAIVYYTNENGIRNATTAKMELNSKIVLLQKEITNYSSNEASLEEMIRIQIDTIFKRILEINLLEETIEKLEIKLKRFKYDRVLED